MKNIILSMLAMSFLSIAVAADGGKTTHKNLSKKATTCCKKGSPCDQRTVCLPGCTCK